MITPRHFAVIINRHGTNAQSATGITTSEFALSRPTACGSRQRGRYATKIIARNAEDLHSSKEEEEEEVTVPHDSELTNARFMFPVPWRTHRTGQTHWRYGPDQGHEPRGRVAAASLVNDVQRERQGDQADGTERFPVTAIENEL